METVLYEGKLNIRAYKYQLIWMLVMTVLSLGLLAVFTIPGAIKIWARLKSTKYKITTEHITIETGLFTKTIDNVDVWRIRDIQFIQRLTDHWFKTCSITILTQDVTNSVFQIKGLLPEEGRKLFTLLRDAATQDRQNKRVMNITA